MLCALIMAGGKGTRFWPKSTEVKPKQFLNLIGDKTMLQMTYERMNKIVDSKNIFIATSNDYLELVKTQIPNINEKNIILEPCSKNTAPCILLSSLYIKEAYGNQNVICVSSDNIIENEDDFIQKLNLVNEFVIQNPSSIVTFGIKPTRPETGFGYLKYEKLNQEIIKIEKFVEKPNYKTAKKYIRKENYLWNAGMFLFNIDNMLKELKVNHFHNYDLLAHLPSIYDESYYKELNEKYSLCEKISIDYAVMEKSNHVYTIPSDFGWDDVGTWKSLERYNKKDQFSNLLKGNVEVINSNKNIIYGSDKKIVLLDVDDLICIDSDDCFIITKRKDIDEIHKLKEVLK